jgi:septal ring factor EnvC (AmiA/AmiB activator)
MKRIAILVMAAFMMSAAVPAFAADMSKDQKDQCLLASKECKTEVDSIQKKIQKLNAEIKKGKKVYSADEIKKLNAKLKEAEDMLDNMMKP